MLARLGVAYAVAASALLLLPIVVPIESGPLAILLLIAPHLALASAALLSIAALARSRSLTVAVSIVAMLFVYRFGGEWWSPTFDGDAAVLSIQVATWNVEADAQAGPDVVALLSRHDLDLIAIEELTPSVAAAIEADPHLNARYPFRALFPTPGLAGFGLLSRYPIVVATNDLHPVRIEAQLDVDGRDVFVLAAHPFPPVITRLAGIPSGFDPSSRNADLELLRQRVVEFEGLHDRVLLMGDFNTAPTEPAFRRLTDGLHDAHAESGLGPGWTWRPARFAFLGIGLLRLDLILSSGSLNPLETSIDCPPIGDHCLLEATLRFVD